MRKYSSKFMGDLAVFAGALWIGTGIGSFGPLPIMLIFDLSIIEKLLLVAILEVVGTSVGIYFLAYRYGYRDRKFKTRMLIINAIIIIALQQMLAPLMGYVPYIASGAKDIARSIWIGNEMERVEPPQGLIHICMSFCTLMIYIPILIAGKYLGAKKYQIEIDKILNESKGGKVE